jgi:hypothetical protein
LPAFILPTPRSGDFLALRIFQGQWYTGRAYSQGY